MDPRTAEDDMGAWILTAETVVSLFQVLSAKKKKRFNFAHYCQANVHLRRFEMNGYTIGSLTKTQS